MIPHLAAAAPPRLQRSQALPRARLCADELALHPDRSAISVARDLLVSRRQRWPITAEQAATAGPAEIRNQPDRTEVEAPVRVLSSVRLIGAPGGPEGSGGDPPGEGTAGRVLNSSVLDTEIETRLRAAQPHRDSHRISAGLCPGGIPGP